MKHIIYMIGVCCSFLSCQSYDKEMVQLETRANVPCTRISEEEPVYSENDEIILGSQRENPYEIHNMLQAYDSLQNLHCSFSLGDNIVPEVNTIYYRVLPADSAEMALLSSDTSIIYFDYPLDYDIERWGSYYHDPTVTDPNITWLYAVVPSDHPLPDIHSLEILQKCYIPDEPIGTDFDSLPDWKNGYAILEYLAYRISGNSDMYNPEDVEMYEYILSELPYLNSRGEDYDSNGNMRCSFWDFICGVKPEGTFSVKNTYTNNSEGIKNAKVYIHNFIKWYCGPMDSTGYYQSAKRFRTKCRYIIRFENHNTRTCIYGGNKFLFGPVNKYLGDHSRYGYDYELQFEDVAWRYASVNNAVEQYYEYCQEYGILFPYDMRVWICGLNDGRWAGSTPLFHKRNVPIQDLIFTIGVHVVGPLALIVYFLDSPDMGLFISQGDHYYETPQLYDLVFHEFGHASHYEKVGNTYWSNYVSHIIFNFGYGNTAAGQYHGYCGIGEMWGNLVGAFFLYKYLGYSQPYIRIEMSGGFDYNGYSPMLPPYVSFNPKEDWYNPGILAWILRNNNYSITDIYNALNPDVYSLEALENSLINQGVNSSVINMAYEVYQYWNQ